MPAQAPMTEATYYILLALMKPGHGYGMMQRIKELSGGRIEMGPGTLYGVLTRMNKEGLITLTSEEGRRKNYATAEQAMKVLKELVDNIVDNDNKYRAFAAQELTELANEWLEDSDEIDTEKITRELFKKRMEISSITVSPDGSLSLFYNDDDMFWGHITKLFRK